MVELYTDFINAGKCKFHVAKADKAQQHQTKCINNRKIDLISAQLKVQI